MALDGSLSPAEKIGFPDSYRVGLEDFIWADILKKLPALSKPAQTILDIGPGCSGLAFRLIDHCQKNRHRLLLADSEEMLQHLPDYPSAHKFPGKFPESFAQFGNYVGQIDTILVYSVIQYAFKDDSMFSFLDCALSLLKPGGRLLVGDIPNVSKRFRFFSSAEGIAYHQHFTGTREHPRPAMPDLLAHAMDDAVVIAIVQRYRNFGFNTYLLPQGIDLPMQNRREDILIEKI
jgi:cyclopropane fatty-acyl-phospholipid synthase-like methyltransferase